LVASDEDARCGQLLHEEAAGRRRVALIARPLDAPIQPCCSAPLIVADQVAAGYATVLNEWGFGAFAAQTPLPDSADPPGGLRVRYTKDLAMEIAWNSVPGTTLELLRSAQRDGSIDPKRPDRADTLKVI
jgi:hypothetical protein